jgi:hypothetical protein
VSRDDQTIPICSTCEQRLKAAQQENDRLLEQNRFLLGAADAFGQLAERLNTELQTERRFAAHDRRGNTRPGEVLRRAASAEHQDESRKA